MGNGSSKNNDSSVDFLGPESPLVQAQTLEFTSSGIRINNKRTSAILTRRELEKMRHANVSNDIRIILNKPFSNVDRITDSLYLTGIGGVLLENIKELKIRCIINATHEMPLAKLPKVASLRVPVDDDPSENIFIYLDDVATVIHNVSKKGGRTMVHCLAGASRSSTLVIAYLIKYQEYTLKNAFCYLKSLRPCARPNIGFFNYLIKYESFYHKNNSVVMQEVKIQGKTVRVPDFYKAEFPDLYRVEVQKQLNQSHMSQVRVQESNQVNYINRNRGVKEMHNDMDKLRQE
ncbi:PREDICTED: dual specificity protein phosphatase 14-like [Rhagoletis zephyria]|uniref:dual specificity protein phosphatase 14-like n=1 Tax=Rhagoletis zephyria TaxID=28612 RepID=UPI0008114407|nr:PREDICTED: dual specificity protein phosphatase 14-like [Rhagoletis zephyria]